MPDYAPVPPLHNRWAKQVLDSAYHVHKNLGPGLLESVYSTCLAHKMAKSGLAFRKELGLPVVYDGIQIEAGYRIDFLVEDAVIVEVKAVDQIHPVHIAQVLTYLKLSDRRLGLLINFNEALLKDGVRRLVC